MGADRNDTAAEFFSICPKASSLSGGL